MSEPITVFVSDPSVDAERVAQALRAAEFHVVDVPLSMLVARVAVQRPRVVIIDADAEGALDAIARMRELPDADGIDVLFCGRPGAALAGAEDALAHEGSGFFARPLNVPTLVKKVESLVGGEADGSKVQAGSQPPVMTQRSTPPSRSSPPAHGPSSRPGPPSAPPGSLRPPSQRIPAPSVVSHALAELLAQAEENAEPPPSSDRVPSPEEEIQAVLPEEVLAALDAPLEGDEDEDEVDGPSRVTTSGGGRSATTGVREPAEEAPPPRAPSVPAEPLTHDGSLSSATTGHRTNEGTAAHRTVSRRSEPPIAHDPTSAVTTPPRRSSSIPPATHLQPMPSAMSSTLGSELLVQQGGMLPPVSPGAVPPFAHPRPGAESSQPMSPAPSTFEEQSSNAREPSTRANSAPQTQGPFQLAPGDAARVVAQAIATRQTGALTLDTPTGVRRIVLREGDIVTASSGVDGESLLAFLGARGDLPRERVEALAGRLPPYGRHAGAALVAQGALGQEQLWPVLRAHAEFLIGQALVVGGGNWLLEPEPPGRLKTEPSVFGGAPGAEIFVDIVRRVVSTADAVRLCGGPSAVLGEGPRAELFRECGLSADDATAIRSARGQRLEAVQASGDLATVVYALWLLGVVDMARSVLDRPSHETKHPDAIDEEALRERIRARLELVDEGDYFALLGVPHNATGYEVRRAYLDLRRTFEPARLLTPALIDLADDVRRITSVLEEAYEILGDNARRERYRRAIDATPGD